MNDDPTRPPNDLPRPGAEHLTGRESPPGFEADLPRFVPARRHGLRLRTSRLFLAFFAVLGLLFMRSALSDPDAGWPWVVGTGGAALFCAILVVKSFRLGLTLESQRVGQRKALVPGSIWIDLDRIEVALPTLIRGRDPVRISSSDLVAPGIPATISPSLCARDQRPRRLAGWFWRFRVRRQHGDLLAEVEARTGRVRILTIDFGDYAPADALEIMRYLVARLAPIHAGALQPALTDAERRVATAELRSR